MKIKLKVFSFAYLLLIIATNVQAQSAFGIRAGVNFSNLTGKMGGDKTDFKILPGFNIGLTYDINVADEFFVQPALLFTTKGAKGNFGYGEGSYNDTKMILNYIELPINFLYKPMLGDGNLLLGVGPYLGYGMSGKYKQGDFTDKIEFGNDKDLKPFDYGGNLLFGYQLSNGISAQLNAQLGMGNMIINGDSDNKLNNTQFGISLGYKF